MNETFDDIADIPTHRGVLAGLTFEEREKAIREQFAPEKLFDQNYALEVLRDRAIVAAPTHDLVAALACLDDETLRIGADLCEIEGIDELGHDELVKAVASTILASDLKLSRDGLFCMSSAEFVSLTRALEADVVVGAEDMVEDIALTGALPYSFLFCEDDTFTLLVPDAVRELLASIDLDEVRRLRRKEAIVARAAEMATIYYGIITVGGLYSLYADLDPVPLSYDEFAMALLRARRLNGDDFEIIERDDEFFIVDPSLTDGFVTDLLSRGQTLDRTSAADVDRELARLADFRDELLELHDAIEPRPLPSTCMRANPDTLFEDVDVFDDLRALPAVFALTAFLDGHVPDGDDDYSYADDLVVQMITLVIQGFQLDEAVALFQECGAFDGLDDQEANELRGLIRRAFDALPLWENNGWSTVEMDDLYGDLRAVRLPGQEAPAKVGRNDPCPCGSGKKYKKCCGKNA